MATDTLLPTREAATWTDEVNTFQNKSFKHFVLHKISVKLVKRRCGYSKGRRSPGPYGRCEVSIFEVRSGASAGQLYVNKAIGSPFKTGDISCQCFKVRSGKNWFNWGFLPGSHWFKIQTTKVSLLITSWFFPVFTSIYSNYLVKKVSKLWGKFHNAIVPFRRQHFF